MKRSVPITAIIMLIGCSGAFQASAEGTTNIFRTAEGVVGTLKCRGDEFSHEIAGIQGTVITLSGGNHVCSATGYCEGLISYNVFLDISDPALCKEAAVEVWQRQTRLTFAQCIGLQNCGN